MYELAPLSFGKLKVYRRRVRVIKLIGNQNFFDI